MNEISREHFSLLIEQLFECAEKYIDEVLNIHELVFSLFANESNHQNSTELFNFCSSEQNIFIIEESSKHFVDYLQNWKEEFYDVDLIQHIVVQTIFALKMKSKKEPSSLSIIQLKKVRYVLAIIAFSYYISKRINFDEYKELFDIKEFEHLSNSYVFYRGQQDCNWRMLPSVFRSIDNNVVFDNSYYKLLTCENGLEKKFDDQMRHNKRNSGLYAYQKYAFFQHSCSYSPLLDLTSDAITALSFALSNSHNKGTFSKTDSVVFLINSKNDTKVISDPKQASVFLKTKMKLQIINDSCIKLGSKYNFINSKEEMVVDSFETLFEMLKPDYRIITCATNDRMNYQAGAFICFTDCIIFNKKVFYEFNNELQINKIFVKHAYKTLILSDIYKNYRERDPEHLMNPYLFFNE